MEGNTVVVVMFAMAACCIWASPGQGRCADGRGRCSGELCWRCGGERLLSFLCLLLLKQLFHHVAISHRGRHVRFGGSSFYLARSFRTCEARYEASRGHSGE